MSRQHPFASGKPAGKGQFLLARRSRVVAPWLPRQGVLLDLGCGNGAQTVHLAAGFSRVIGVDIVPDFLRLFSETLAPVAGGVEVLGMVSDGSRLPLRSASVDCVVSFEVLEHVADERETLQEIRRVLKPGGRLVVSVPNKWWIFETHGADLPLLRWNRVPFFSWLPRRIHERYARARIYTRRRIRHLLTMHGFAVRHETYLTAPMDMAPSAALRSFLRSTVFSRDTTACPFLSTSIVCVADRS